MICQCSGACVCRLTEVSLSRTLAKLVAIGYCHSENSANGPAAALRDGRLERAADDTGHSGQLWMATASTSSLPRALRQASSAARPSALQQIEGRSAWFRLDRNLCLVILLAAIAVLPRSYLIAQAHSESVDDDFHLTRGLVFLTRGFAGSDLELNDPPLGEGIIAIPMLVTNLIEGRGARRRPTLRRASPGGNDRCPYRPVELALVRGVPRRRLHLVPKCLWRPAGLARGCPVRGRSKFHRPRSDPGARRPGSRGDRDRRPSWPGATSSGPRRRD